MINKRDFYFKCEIMSGPRKGEEMEIWKGYSPRSSGHLTIVGRALECLRKGSLWSVI